MTPLYELTKSSVRDRLLWKPRHEQAFRNLEKALPQPPSQASLTAKSPFVCLLQERSQQALGISIQLHGSYQKPLTYYNLTLDPVTKA